MVNASPLNDPFKDWPNDDLLLTEESRIRLQATRPRLLRILDWPELRDAFGRHDGPAGTGKRWSRRQGVGSVLFAGLGVILLSLLPILPQRDQNLATGLALASMFIGGLVGVLHWGLLRSKHSWLGHRFWTERLRQLHFQSLVNHVEFAAKAITDDAAFDALVQYRRLWLADLYHDPDDPQVRIRALLQDRTESRTWIRHEWEPGQPSVGASTEVDEVLEGLYRLRIGIQSTYADKNLGSDVYSPSIRSKFLKATVNSCFLLIVPVAVAGLISMLLQQPILGANVTLWTIIAAVASAVGLMAQSINQGLQNEAELDRYEWYAEEVGQVKAAYERGGRQAKVEALRQLEHASYRELRLFLRAHSAARFMG